MSPIALVGSLAGNGTLRIENAKLARLNPSAFSTVLRAVDQGLPADPARVREKMDTALSAGPLTIPLTEGALTIDAGLLRLSAPALRAQGADLAVSGSVNLGEISVDARLTMSAIGAGGPTSSRPEIGIALKGPIEAPKRTVDVTTLASWLAMRAVEQQSEKLDALEGRTPAQPRAAAAPEAAIALPQPDGAVSPARSEPQVPRPRPAVRSKPRPPPSEQAQPASPPIDIRPAPRAPPRSSGSQGVASQSQGRPPAAAAPSRPRSLSEILFGN
jgi:large subunit ribosomal protein L24